MLAVLFLGWLVVMLYQVRQMVLACRETVAGEGGGSGTVMGPVVLLDAVYLDRVSALAGGCAAGEFNVKNMENSSDTLIMEAASFDAVCNNAGGSCGSEGCENNSGNGDAMPHRLEVLMQDQADSVEGLVHRLAAILRRYPGLRVVLVDGGSSDETGLILERLARCYNLGFLGLAERGAASVGTSGSEADCGPVRCLDLRGLSGRDLLKYDLSAWN